MKLASAGGTAFATRAATTGSAFVTEICSSSRLLSWAASIAIASLGTLPRRLLRDEISDRVGLRDALVRPSEALARQERAERLLGGPDLLLNPHEGRRRVQLRLTRRQHVRARDDESTSARPRTHADATASDRRLKWSSPLSVGAAEAAATSPRGQDRLAGRPASRHARGTRKRAVPRTEACS